MPEPVRPGSVSQGNRREFLRSSTAVAGGALLGGLSLARSAHAAGSDVLKIGLIGCGGRGSGAAGNALNADAGANLYALGDAFEDRLQGSLHGLKQQYGQRVDVDASRQFVGLDAYQKVIDSGVDVVLLATPPHFRPIHLKAAVDAGKQVFCEKPVAVDAPGVRSVLATTEEARKKKLNLVSGLCWRYHRGVKETIERVLDGSIGDLRAIQTTYLTGPLWNRPRQPGDSEMRYQVRNWYYFAWLSGDFNTEQHVHSLDKALWAMHDEPPLRAWGLGGRQVRTDAIYGDIYDHHAVVYEWPGGVRVFSYCRQQGGCYSDVSDHFLGSLGEADILKHKITGKTPWHFAGDGGNMYDLEHQALFAAIRSGEPINNGLYMARSTMLAILGRMVNYTGRMLTWDEALASQQLLAPASYTWDAEPPTRPGPDGRYPVAMPGQTKFV
jgi:predicted dehydrogenase